MISEFKHLQLNVAFNSQGYAFTPAQETSTDSILNAAEGEKIGENTFFLGRTANVFYSLKITRQDSLPEASKEELPLALISKNFFRQRVVCGIIGCKEGSDRFSEETQTYALKCGEAVAQMGFTTLTGGLSGVMERAAKGAWQSGGETIGILPGNIKKDANPYVKNVIPSGIGYARNYIIAQASDVLVALNGGRGTLEEICFGLDFDKKVLSLKSWDIPGVDLINTIEDVQGHLKSLFDEKFLSNLEERFE